LQAALLQRAGDDFISASQDLFGVVLYPTRRGKNLLMLLLRHGHHVRIFVNTMNACWSSLVNRPNVASHLCDPLFI